MLAQNVLIPMIGIGNVTAKEAAIFPLLSVKTFLPSAILLRNFLFKIFSFFFFLLYFSDVSWSFIEFD
jgi:hypothetical protein